ncbi:MAG: IPT/TIG domain-containing protein, partial [Thermoanaerobaculaceae bacterium]|nr:IPT/TIG domain-containing protein [Thermoanaerobaculaceae bacterium]
MMRNSKYIAMALGAAVLLAGCSAKSPTAPKPTPIPAFNISLTPAATTAKAGESVRVTAQVTTGSANAPDGTAVTFDVSGGEFPPTGATEAVRTTTGGSTNISVTSSGGTATILGRVPGGSDETSVTFTGIPPTPTPPGPTPTPSYDPQIFALTPNAGPFEGGTRVLISGTGFQTPVQVLFDDIQAQVVSTSYTEVVCVSPSITPTAPNDVITKQVTVTNIGNGKKSSGVGFRYGVAMFISSFSPMEGPADTPTTVTIFGQGFVAPVSVVASSG